MARKAFDYKHLFLAILFASILLNISALAFAEPVVVTPTASHTASNLPPSLDLGSSIFTMLKGLGICLALLFAGVWLLKKLKNPMITGQGKSMKIIERLPVSAKSSLLLVEVDGKRVLIGVGADPVHLVSEFFADRITETKEGEGYEPKGN